MIEVKCLTWSRCSPDSWWKTWRCTGVGMRDAGKSASGAGGGRGGLRSEVGCRHRVGMGWAGLQDGTGGCGHDLTGGNGSRGCS